ncbi:hypothetical protein HNR59_001255 [Aquamicrobium lusatiense]|uniref:Arc-like DNA binding domain-containing protein n=1 Tax=Aquamicrobium lusatiense TaxID=89772 RepID=A0A7W9VV82_9HYPH|nr:Arc family DNA-binding protein [Aquamicrobium lusatiense]MBB6011910.1 hypothetical protein [Aquamicrobium lusatiense]
MAKGPAQPQDKYVVRFPDGMREKLKGLATEHKRSLNAEIIARLAEFEEMDARLYDALEENERLTAEVSALRVIKAQFNEIGDRLFDESGNVKPFVVVPPDLLDRIRRAANGSYRTIDAEVIATLEEAYPNTSAFLRDLKFFYFQWGSGTWHTVDEDSWARFKSGEVPKHIADRMSERDNYFAVAVIDAECGLVNVIPHNYHISDGGAVWAAYELLTDEEKENYARLMTSANMKEEDEKRIKELRDKMAPAISLPPDAISHLRQMLSGLAPDDELDVIFERLA